ncbi:protein of unknown function DUF905 [Morganella phage Mecenats66]|nr:protein of unknown function DUF905 [Morganella phage Mecenats66]
MENQTEQKRLTREQIEAIAAPVAAHVDIAYNTDRYGNTQIEFRSKEDGSLSWRCWNFESDFEYGLKKHVSLLADYIARGWI